MKFRKHGITKDTPGNIMLGAGTVHRNFEFKDGEWNIKESIFGATSGGNKLSINPEVISVEVDGAHVKVKGLDFKQGETAKLELNLVEITPELIQPTVIGEEGQSDADGYKMYTTKPNIDPGDYVQNLAFVGYKTDDTPIIVVFDWALCTTGLDIEGKDKDKVVVKCVFECYQDVEEDLDTLPIRIYYLDEGEEDEA